MEKRRVIFLAIASILIIFPAIIKKLIEEILMINTARTLASLFSSTSLILILWAPAPANANGGLESQISLGLFLETVEYREQEKDTGIDSKARLHNLVVGVEGLKRWKYFFCGVKSVIPVLLGSDHEEVSRSGESFQKNNLELRWVRIDGFLGYPLRYWANPYLGIRWSEVRQERTDIVIRGIPIDLRSVEEIRSWCLLLGLRGGGSFSPRVRWNYWMEYFFPLNVEVTNTALPGFKATDKDGHTVELKWGVNYLYTESLCFGLELYGGWMHWDGSEWKSLNHSLAKWPENDTFHLGGGLKVIYKF